MRLTLPRHPSLPDPTPSFLPILPIIHSLALPRYCRSHFSAQNVSPKPVLHGLALASSNISLTPNPSLNLGAGTSLTHSFTSPILPTTPSTTFGSLRSTIPFRSWRDPRTSICFYTASFRPSHCILSLESFLVPHTCIRPIVPHGRSPQTIFTIVEPSDFYTGRATLYNGEYMRD